MSAAWPLALALAAGGAAAQDKIKAVLDLCRSDRRSRLVLSAQSGPPGAWRQELGDKVETVFVENVAEADAERTIERLARDGCKIIFTTSFGFMEPTLKVAKKFPDVKFEHATGYKTADNVTTYNAKFHEGRYVIGQIAAKMSKTGVAGYIVSFPIPEVVSGINAFMLGAQSVNPDFKVKIVWVNTWYDPGKEADAAKVLFSQGADIIVQHTDSTAPLQIAEEQGKHRLRPGFRHDQVRAQGAAHGDRRQLGALLHRARQGRAWTAPGNRSRPGMAWPKARSRSRPSPTCPTMSRRWRPRRRRRSRPAQLHPFTGPITKQDGTVVGEAGKPLPDGDILGMNWYVKGVDDKLPQ